MNTKQIDVPEQEFNGKSYKLYDGERYFSRGVKRLHRVVWEYFNGEIPDGFDVHHKDENTFNNSVENLEIIEQHKHQSIHIKKRVVENREWFDRFRTAGIEAAKVWHGSEEGNKWHSNHAKEMGFGTMTYGQRKCSVCGDEFIALTNSQEFCTQVCRSQDRRNRKVDDVTRLCEYCGVEFSVDKYAKSTCCSRRCGKKNSIEKKKLVA